MASKGRKGGGMTRIYDQFSLMHVDGDSDGMREVTHVGLI